MQWKKGLQFILLGCLLAVQISAYGQKKPVKDTARQDTSDEAEYNYKLFTTIEKPPEFPGGSEGWRQYLAKNLKYPKKAMDQNIQGVVRVQFMVDKTGKVSSIKALNDPGGGLAEEAIRIIKKGPNWIPAEQAGRKVSFRHVQAITFLLQEEEE